MDASVVVATYNQQERLRLVLRGLAGQSVPASRFEVIVAMDGCTDGTQELVQGFDPPYELRAVALPQNGGANPARNAGAAQARAPLLAFLDGDALPHPRWLEHHLAAMDSGAPCVQGGAEYSLAQTEYLRDPQRGTPMDEVTPSVVRDYIRLHRDEMVVTEAMVADEFETIEQRTFPAGYPFPTLKEIQDQTRVLSEQRPGSPIGWIGLYPHNAMLPRQAFEDVGGFAAEMRFHEGWELGYRLQRRAPACRFVAEACTYHLYHYHELSDAARAHEEQRLRRRLLNHMAIKHGDPRLLLVQLWQASIWPDPLVPQELRIPTLVELHDRYVEADSGLLQACETLLRRHPLWGEGSGTWDFGQLPGAPASPPGVVRAVTPRTT
ncbi:MAG: glycosyltransferase [Candidatus Latescibacterota bacterium]